MGKEAAVWAHARAGALRCPCQWVSRPGEQIPISATGEANESARCWNHRKVTVLESRNP